MYTGGFGSWFSVQNALSRAAPLLMTALCVALPARLGLIVIGAEGAVVLGGLAAAALALPLVSVLPPAIVWIAMGLAAMVVGGIWIGLSGVLRHYRGVNETIASLLLAYIAIALMNHLIEGLCATQRASTSHRPRPCRPTTSSARSPAWMCIGAGCRRGCLRLVLCADRSDERRLRRAHRR
jgi:simple sugar transport system permease protein